MFDREVRLADARLKMSYKRRLDILEGSRAAHRFNLLPGFQVMSFAVISVFEFANREIGEQVYDFICCPRPAGPSALDRHQLATEPFDQTNFDTLMSAAAQWLDR